MRRVGLSLLLVAIVVGPAFGQRIDVPDFVVISSAGTNKQRTVPTVAGGVDGTIFFAWRDRTAGEDLRFAYGRRFSAAGLALAPEIRLDDTADVSTPRIAAAALGGYVGVWRHVNIPLGINLRPFAADGAATAASLLVFGGSNSFHELASLPSGTVVVWNVFGSVRGRLFDAAGQPRAVAFTIGTAANEGIVDVAATSDGGFVVAWDDEGETWGRRYDGNGGALGPAALLNDKFTINDVAASPLGGFVIVGTQEADSHTQPRGVWGRRFDAAGTAVGLPFLIAARPEPTTQRPQAEFEAGGNLYVVWGETGTGLDPPHARTYDPAGRPRGSSFEVTNNTASTVATDVLADGRMVNTWLVNDDIRANVVAICAPPYHTGCGNGVVTPPCERCDQGAANSDTTPNACRTTCQRASCGDGVVDAGEECDDGNAFGCDGCDANCDLEPGYVCGDGVTFAACGEACDAGAANSDTAPDACRTNCQLPACGDDVIDGNEDCDDGNNNSCDGCSSICVAEPGLVCGDGIPELECNEECDDGNAIVGDGCKAGCRLERIPGGGSYRTDCLVEWSINNPSNVPLLDKHGTINGVQSCVDGDPQCDFDGGMAGTCTFAVRVCANNTDIEGCVRPSRLSSWELMSPSAKKAVKDPIAAALRAAFATVPGSIVGPSARNVCSDTIQATVPLHKGKAGKVGLKARARSYDEFGGSDTDKLKLICLPAGN